MKKLFLFIIISLSFIHLHAAFHESQGWGLTKPPEGTPVNWGDPITQGLVSFFPLGENGGRWKNIVNGEDSTPFLGTGKPKNSADKFNSKSSLFNSSLSTTINSIKLPVINSSHTICVWFKGNSNTASTQIMLVYGKQGSGISQNFQLSIRNSGYRYFVTDDLNNQIVIDTGTFSTTSWQCITVTKAGGTAVFYINGIKMSTKVGTPGVTSSNQFMIGAFVQDPLISGYLDGSLDLFSVWNRSLNPSEVRRLYEEPMCLFAPHKIHFQTINQTITNLIRSFGQIF